MEKYLENYEGVADAGTEAIAADATIRLPDQPCRYVMLFNWTVTQVTALTTPKNSALSSSPEAAATGTELYYGFGGKMCGQLFAGSATVLLPVNNLNQISVRAVAGATGTVHYVFFR